MLPRGENVVQTDIKLQCGERLLEIGIDGAGLAIDVQRESAIRFAGDRRLHAVEVQRAASMFAVELRERDAICVGRRRLAGSHIDGGDIDRHQATHRFERIRDERIAELRVASVDSKRGIGALVAQFLLLLRPRQNRPGRRRVVSSAPV